METCLIARNPPGKTGANHDSCLVSLFNLQNSRSSDADGSVSIFPYI